MLPILAGVSVTFPAALEERCTFLEHAGIHSTLHTSRGLGAKSSNYRRLPPTIAHSAACCAVLTRDKVRFLWNFVQLQQVSDAGGRVSFSLTTCLWGWHYPPSRSISASSAESFWNVPLPLYLGATNKGCSAIRKFKTIWSFAEM